MFARFSSITIAFALAALPLLAQEPGTTAPAVIKFANVKYPSYTARYKLVSLYVNEDGSTLSLPAEYTEAQGAHHREFSSFTSFSPSTGDSFSTHAVVTDPEQGLWTEWDSISHRTMVVTMPALDQRYGCWVSQSGDYKRNFGPPKSDAPPSSDSSASPARPPTSAMRMDSPQIHAIRQRSPSDPTFEDLGIKVIQGARAHGFRTTWPIPPNASEMEKQQSSMEEHWVALDLNKWIEQRVDYWPRPNRTRRWTKELLEMRAGEPDPALYQPPEDYDVVNEEMHEVPCSQM
jgi:hypothetical protein